MEVSINKYPRQLIWWLKYHISILWNSEKNKNVDQHMVWILCQKVQPANHPLVFPIFLAAPGWHSDPPGLPQPHNAGPPEWQLMSILGHCTMKIQEENVTIFLSPKALVHYPLWQRPPIAEEDPVKETLLSNVVGVDVAAKSWIKCPLRTLPIFYKTSEMLPSALLPASQCSWITK